jgi:four helix bundle protein
MAKRLEDLKVFSKATELSTAVNAILARFVLRRNSKAWNQISEANDSILSNMQEGFEQTSDDGFAKYLVYSKGSTAEVVARLRGVKDRKQIPAEEFERIAALGTELGKMLGGLIKYLRRSGFKDRGSHRSKQGRHSPPEPTRDSGRGTRD